MFASCLSSLTEHSMPLTVSSLSILSKKIRENPKLPDSILQIIVYPSLDITKKHSYRNKCNSLFLCEELLLIMTFCTYILQHTLLHLQYSSKWHLKNLKCCMSNEYQWILQNLCRLQTYGSVTPCGHWQTNWRATRLHYSLDVTWIKFLMIIGLLWISACVFQVTKNEHCDLESVGNCLHSIKSWTGMNF